MAIFEDDDRHPLFLTNWWAEDGVPVELDPYIFPIAEGESVTWRWQLRRGGIARPTSEEVRAVLSAGLKAAVLGDLRRDLQEAVWEEQKILDRLKVDAEMVAIAFHDATGYERGIEAGKIEGRIEMLEREGAK